jgi:transaldolase
MTRLHDLYEQAGQSPWIDNLTRGYLQRGRLDELVASGVRGVTSNPTITAKAIEESEDYDEPFAKLIGADVVDAYWTLAIDDVKRALEHLAPLYEASGGVDGVASIEVDPSLAHDTAGTIRSARHLHERLQRPNALVKIPATHEGVPAVQTLIAEGRSINVTLIFSLPRYEAVIEAYLSGIEQLVARGGDPANVTSVASFFISRVDTEVDRRLEDIAATADCSLLRSHALELRGHVAVAQARLAYAMFRRAFSGQRWQALAEAGARVQRPLWASTSTKNPAYPDLVYVESLIGPDTVNTMPEPTIEAFLDHGKVHRGIEDAPEDAGRVLQELEEVGVALADVAATLERLGVASFESSFDNVKERLAKKAHEMA